MCRNSGCIPLYVVAFVLERAQPSPLLTGTEVVVKVRVAPR